MNPLLKILFLLILIICYSVSNGQAQENKQPFLKDYIVYLENKNHVTFLFDSDLVKDIRIGFDTIGLDLPNALIKLNRNTAFNFDKQSSDIIQVKPKVAGTNLTICGTLLDKESKETIPSGSIFYNNGKSGILTDANGSFNFSVHLANNDSIVFYCFGYEAVRIASEYFNGNNCLHIYLPAAIKQMDPVVIESYLMGGIDYDLKDNSIKIKPNSLGFLAGETDADILYTLDALPGISTPDTRAGNLNIRGSSPDQTLIQFDNIPIYHKGHYFGTLSPYNPNVIDEISVSRGAYMADKGGRVGGAIEIKSGKNIPDSARYGIGLSAVNASAYMQIPIVKNKIGILLGGRTSYPFGWTGPKLNAIQNFVYQESDIHAVETNPSMSFLKNSYYFNDCNAKLIVKLSKKDQLSLSFLNISNRVLFEIKDDQKNTLRYDKITLENWGYNIDWSRDWSKRISTHVKGTQSSYAQSFISRTTYLPDSVAIDAFFKNGIEDISLNVTTDATVSEASSFNFGYNLQYNYQQYINNAAYNSGSTHIDLSNLKNAFLHSLFGNYKLGNISKKYIVNTGLRVNYYTPSGSFYFEPRIMGTYFLTDHLSLKGSAGIYHQYLMQIPGISIRTIGGIDNLLWLLADGDKIPVVNSRQFMLGGIFKKRSWVVDLEGYYKLIDNISINNIANFQSPNPYIYGSGNTLGADLLVKKSFKNIDAWISYTYCNTQMKFDSTHPSSFPSVWNQTHVLDVAFAYQWRQWKFSSVWKYRSGLAALNGIRAPYLAGPPFSSLGNSNPPPPGGGGPPNYLPGSAYKYNNLFPAYHQLDVSLVYCYPKQKKNWNGTIGLSVLNAYNQKNIVAQSMRHQPNGVLIVNKYAMGFAPNLMMTLNW